MTKTFKVERKGKQTIVVVRQLTHDTQYRVGMTIPGIGRVIADMTFERGYTVNVLAGRRAPGPKVLGALGITVTYEQVEK